MRTHPLVFGVGPAGTGKTYLAAAFGAHLLYERRIERLILSRPALEAGERLGFLPGDLSEKIDPYLRPLYDALFDVMGEQCVKLMEQGMIEVAPLAFMRGRTLARAFVILDEAQNCILGADAHVPDPAGRGFAHGRVRRLHPERSARRPGRGPQRGARCALAASRAWPWPVSPTRTWCAMRSSPASCAPIVRRG